MSRIRPVERADLSQVASLFESVMRSGGRTPPPGLAAYFERTLLDQPWADPEIPSLVYEGAGGRIGGFLGAHVRRLRFDGRRVRMAWPGQFVSDPADRNPAVGALLVRTFLAGAQDVSIAEATEKVTGMWTRLGGVVLHGPSVAWNRFFRPARVLGDQLLDRSGRTQWNARARPALQATDALAKRILSDLRPEAPSVRAEPLTPQALIEHLPAVVGGARLVPDYSEAFLGWLFDELAFVSTRGSVVRCLVRDDRRVLGWYVTYLKPGGVGQVMQIAAADADRPAVIDHLFHHAWRSGTGALEGRLEPELHEPLRGRRCVMTFGSRVLAHSRDAELLRVLERGQGFVTRMDGEWWMGHHREAFA